MNNWWENKKERTRKHRKHGEKYTFGDFIMDVLFWIPELIILPFRLVFWVFRGLWRLFDFT
ncbi:hypothetical protein [Ornithinibacillus halotolerans]|uniref:Uncharacterized protein n=1 Tax=Ornithinibacillus halotolerans TaxID=1274357 RepID=A0A916RRV3_9BACI|nr:hypothetical protein [Ornithinibacillus halotolerans]GGA68207.1 hypothetical protein GCM10008025_10190 [Ornithinibacillus halotolerans]